MQSFQADLEIGGALAWIRGTAALPDVGQAELLEDNDRHKIYTRYTPLGVVAGIVPWNFPVLLMAAKIAPALITGNTIILKPSPFTPYCNLKLVELAQDYFPPGVVQILSGDNDLGS